LENPRGQIPNDGPQDACGKSREKMGNPHDAGHQPEIRPEIPLDRAENHELERFPHFDSDSQDGMPPPAYSEDPQDVSQPGTSDFNMNVVYPEDVWSHWAEGVDLQIQGNMGEIKNLQQDVENLQQICTFETWNAWLRTALMSGTSKIKDYVEDLVASHIQNLPNLVKGWVGEEMHLRTHAPGNCR
jgi:hypothetical protein